MREITILATVGGTGAHGIFQSWRANGERKVRIIGTDMRPDAYGLFLADKAYVVPPAYSESYIDKMLDIVKKEKVDIVVPFSPSELLPLAKNKKLFEEHGAKVLVSDAICLCTAAGVNLAYLGVKLALGEEVDIPEPIYGVRMIRHMGEIYIDENGHTYTL